MNKPVTITFLGTGTSTGVPMIGCSCVVCQSTDRRDQRLRTSLLLECWNGFTIVIDTGPDFRQQMLRAKVKRLDAVLLTHEHNDHIAGLDDVRPFNFRQKQAMSVYARSSVQQKLKTAFPYIFVEGTDKYPGSPSIQLHTIHANQSFQLNGINITVITYLHGSLPVFGFRFDLPSGKSFCYITDIKRISPAEKAKLYGTDVLILSAIRQHKPHWSHLILPEAIALSKEVATKTAYFTHISHNMGLHKSVTNFLSNNMHLAFDELQLVL